MTVRTAAQRPAPPLAPDGTPVPPAFRRWSTTYGFTLIELLIVVVIIGALAGIVTPNLQRNADRARVAAATEEIRFLQAEIMGYRADDGELPPTLADIGREAFLDPWGNPYVYLNFIGVQGQGQKRKDRFLVPLNTEYDLYSIGADGLTAPALTAAESHDDVIRANDGGFVGLAKSY